MALLGGSSIAIGNNKKQICAGSMNSRSSDQDSDIPQKQKINIKIGEYSRNRICRGFLNKACHKKICRYPHFMKSGSLVFCHDYQNKKCHRGKCKFLHYSIEEEEYFKKNGEFPDFCDFGADFRCNDFVTFGYCKHQENARKKRERQDFDPNRHERPSPMTSPLQPQTNVPLPGNCSGYLFHPPPYLNDCGAMDDHLSSTRTTAPTEWLHKNRGYNSLRDEHQPPKFDSDIIPNYESTIRRYCVDLDIITIIRRFEEDHNMMRRRVEANEIQIAELRASYEYLLAQMTQYRMNTVQCSRVVNPVTVTNTSTQPQGQTAQVLSAVSMAPVQVQATPIVSMAGPQTQLIASNGPPLAIANTSQGQQLALTQQSLSNLSTSTELMGPPPQILSTSQITLAPALASASSMGLTINTSQALAMSNATQPIISYPIMTHSILPH